jgi:hypothetical protein
MDIIVHEEPMPVEYSPSEHHVDVQHGGGDGKHVHFSIQPFAQGELWRARGLLNGLGYSFIEGEMIFKCHEGLVQTTGEVTIYGEESLQVFHIVMQLVDMALRSVAGFFVGEDHSITATYSFEWIDEVPEEQEG